MRLNAISFGEAADGRPPIVLLHGLFGSARNWGQHQKTLGAGGRLVIALDLRNHGDSPHGPVTSYAAMAEDVAETLESLGHRLCRLLGHSMGGKVAMALALSRPALLDRVVVADIAPRTYEHGNADLAAAMRGLEITPGMTRAEASAALASRIPNAMIRSFLMLNLRLGNTQPNGWRIGLSEIAEGMSVIEGWQPVPRVYDGPALFITGGRSDYVPETAYPDIRALFPAVRFATLPDAGHWLHVDDPAGFLAAVTPFLDGAEA
ncbi:MAG TPA: alpha/beta fold hydrolase [Acidisoma sp.]|jgi:pimeloyl-ACP methyl ester carboxylesterase|uniref:alpha/beta fold hydrolase n=1 Tax=Acidisoma sp. TaxID=1872115 RepID=UPI002D13C9D5|nr:alpha/beta fold hydrolase [Acidisoma sp.]HTI03394.1 alpha/beta fold hydrolase [Acidisoma sp.]